MSSCSSSSLRSTQRSSRILNTGTNTCSVHSIGLAGITSSSPPSYVNHTLRVLGRYRTALDWGIVCFSMLNVLTRPGFAYNSDVEFADYCWAPANGPTTVTKFIFKAGTCFLAPACDCDSVVGTSCLRLLMRGNGCKVFVLCRLFFIGRSMISAFLKPFGTVLLILLLF